MNAFSKGERIKEKMQNESNRKKMTYFMITSWRHIFQRPHILALLLEKDYKIQVVEKYYCRDLLLPRQKVKPHNMVSIIQLPRERRFEFVKRFNRRHTEKIVKHYLNTNTDFVWISHPSQYQYIPENFKGTVIYDCMDNYKELGTEEQRNSIKIHEKQLVKRADVIFASSQWLVDKINEPQKTVLVRNGYLRTETVFPIKGAVKKKEYKICYIGTISNWFDFEAISFVRQNINNVSFDAVGFADIDKRRMEGILEHKGIIEHSKLSGAVKNYDAFVMPFVVNEIVECVDPVKLYEYILYGKCIISVWYEEIERFRPFVYFYNTKEELLKLIFQLSQEGFPPKYSESERSLFLEKNSWEERYALIKESLARVTKKHTGS